MVSYFRVKAKRDIKRQYKKTKQKKTQIEYFTPGERSDRENFLVEAYCLKGIYSEPKAKRDKRFKKITLFKRIGNRNNRKSRVL